MNLSTRIATTAASKRHQRSAIAIAGLAFVVSAAVASIGLVEAKQVSPVPQAPSEVRGLPGSFADLVASVKPAVVNISASGAVGSGNGDWRQRHRSMEEFNEFFKRFFGRPMPDTPGHEQGRKMRAQGSGFFISADGYLVTNQHVVKGADEIKVITDDGDSFPAEFVAADAKTDIALLKVKADRDLPFVTFGDSESARVGDWVIAIGNPFGLGGTTTTGIISARGRDLNSGPLDDFIQIDAPINQGNSGGPLFNTRGEVIGVNTAIFSPNGGSVGIGFAIPARITTNVVAQLQKDGVVRRGWLGVQIQVVSDEIAESLGLDDARGALVASVVENSPASSAGIEPGDVITEFDGANVETMRELPKIVANTGVDSDVKIKVWRDGGEKILSTRVGSSENARQLAGNPSVPERASEEQFGLRLSSLTEELRNRYRIDESIEGVVVTGVSSDSEAARQGIRDGDVIKRVGQKAVATPSDVVEQVDEIKQASRSSVLLLVNRRGVDQFVALKIA